MKQKTIIKQKRATDKQSIEEIANRVAADCIAKKEAKKEELNAFLKQVIAKTDKNYPHEDEDFLSYIPEYHQSWYAIREISANTRMADIYALTIVKIYQGKLPLELEMVILNLDGDYLILKITAAGHEWSSRAKTVMEKFHPNAYLKIFTKKHDSLLMQIQ